MKGNYAIRLRERHAGWAAIFTPDEFEDAKRESIRRRISRHNAQHGGTWLTLKAPKGRTAKTRA